MRKYAGTFAFGVPMLGLALWAGTVSAGTVNVDCYCNPEGSTDMKCVCDNSKGLSGLATNEFDRRCKVTYAYPFLPQWDGTTAPKTLVRDIPSNVTCTRAQSSFGNPLTNEWPEYIWNDCTNWNLSKKSVTILSYCYWSPD